jgi:phosphoenolpyruvate phosphomutase
MKQSILKSMIAEKKTHYLMEASNALSAKIVEEAGFKAIWASGLTMCASQGLRDCNEASWTELLAIAECMADVTSVPILFDADTGYGNFNNVRRLVKKLEQIDIAGMCIEDKKFPKSNSLIDAWQELITIEEFSGKIKAAKDVQSKKDFVVVARTEALIVGATVGEALARADAYRLAGADAIVLHNKSTSIESVEIFCREWANRLPIVLIPTTYFKDLKSKIDVIEPSLIVFANHTLRAAVKAMKSVAQKLHETLDLQSIEDNIDPLEEIFRLQNTAELIDAYRRYQG